jgi:uncharacterized protein (DUF58 family)
MDFKRFQLEKGFKWAILFGVLWIGLAAVTGSRFFYFVSYVWLIFLVSSIGIHRLNTLHLISQFEIEKTELSAGDDIAIRYRVLNNSIIPAFNVQIYPMISKSFGYEQFDSDRHGFDSFEAKVIDRKLKCHRRGFYTLGEVAFEVHDPLGLVTSHFSKSKVIEVVVRPRIYYIDEQIPMPLERSGSRGMSIRHQADRTSIKSVRPYLDGDQIRDIHWKLTAKTGEVKVKEFTQSVSEKVYLFIDGCKESYLENPELSDEAMDLAASLCHVWLKRGIPVEVIFSDEGRTHFSGRNMASQGKFLDHFTAFNPNGWIGFEDFLEKEIKWHRDGACWVTISTGISHKLEQMLSAERSQQFAWTYYTVSGEGRQQQ